MPRRSLQSWPPGRALNDLTTLRWTFVWPIQERPRAATSNAPPLSTATTGGAQGTAAAIHRRDGRAQCRSKEVPFKLADGEGLYLPVQPTGIKVVAVSCLVNMKLP